MGSAPSSQPDVGVSINPRVEYASKVAQAAKKVRSYSYSNYYTQYEYHSESLTITEWLISNY